MDFGVYEIAAFSKSGEPTVKMIKLSDHQQALAEKDEKIERLKQEAQIHAQEARTANHTIAEIYQVVCGATGEPGNWHGAEPVRQALAEKDREIAHLKEKVAHYDRWLSAGVYFTVEEYQEQVYKPRQQLMAQAVRFAQTVSRSGRWQAHVWDEAQAFLKEHQS